MLAILSIFSYKQNLELIKISMLVNHTNLIRLETENELSLLKDAETGSVGYLVTADSAFLTPYFNALRDIPGSLKNLDSLVEEPNQKINVEKLVILTKRRIAFLDALISLPLTANALHDSLSRGKEQMDELRAHAALMIHEEERLLRLRTASLNSAVSFAPASNVLIVGFSILLLIFSYFKIARELELTKVLEQQLLTANEVLKKSNNELFQFAYVASHDLQEPLRKIQTFISRIEDTEPAMSDRGRDYFKRINISAKRMQQLILDILSYSKANNEDKIFELTELNDALEAAKDQLEHFITERNAVIRAENLPPIHVVRYQFEQLFVNLLSNALKFSKPGTPCVISITAKIINGKEIIHNAADKNLRYHCIEVSDNGIGFEPQYGERIFKIFNRLNPKEDFEGNGIGLSIVKKIMEAHHGFITATGTPGKGATFSLYLPA